MAAYLTNLTAAPIAAAMPAAMLSAYLALGSSDQDLYLEQASEDVDVATKFQGRKFADDQVLQFPRVAYPYDGMPAYEARVTDQPGCENQSLGRIIWDWDPINLVAVVPPQILKAVVWQADYLARGGARAGGRLDQQHEGIKDQMTGPLRETYGEAAGLRTGVCRRTWQLLIPYVLQTGRMS